MFNVKKFIDRNHWTLEELANRLFDKGGASRVGNWSSGTSNPRYEVILKLIELGVTAEELLGKEHADLLIGNSLDDAAIEALLGDSLAKKVIPPEVLNNAEFQEGLQKSIDAKVKAAVDSAFKAKGLL